MKDFINLCGAVEKLYTAVEVMHQEMELSEMGTSAVLLRNGRKELREAMGLPKEGS